MRARAMGLVGLSRASLRPTVRFARSSSAISEAFHSATNARAPSFDHRERDGIGGWHGVALGKVEAFFDCAGRGIEKQDIVGEIVGDEQLFSAG